LCGIIISVAGRKANNKQQENKIFYFYFKNLLTFNYIHDKLYFVVKNDSNCSLKTEQNNQYVKKNRNLCFSFKPRRFTFWITKLRLYIVAKQLFQTFLESLILAQDERWRRA